MVACFKYHCGGGAGSLYDANRMQIFNRQTVEYTEAHFDVTRLLSNRIVYSVMRIPRVDPHTMDVKEKDYNIVVSYGLRIGKLTMNWDTGKIKEFSEQED